SVRRLLRAARGRPGSQQRGDQGGLPGPDGPRSCRSEPRRRARQGADDPADPGQDDAARRAPPDGLRSRAHELVRRRADRHGAAAVERRPSAGSRRRIRAPRARRSARRLARPTDRRCRRRGGRHRARSRGQGSRRSSRPQAPAELALTGPGALARALGRWVAWITRSKRNSGLTVLIAVLLATAALGYGKSIRVDTDLRALLPKTAPSVVALDELEQRSGASERFIVAIEARTPEDADAMAKGIAEEIASWPEAEQLSIVRDYTAIRDHALYFIELEQLETLRDELDAQRKRAVARAMGPGLTDGEIDP